MKNNFFNLAVILVLALLISSCNSPNYSALPDKYAFSELRIVSMRRPINLHSIKEAFFIDEQSLTFKNNRKFYLVILKESEPLYDQCRPGLDIVPTPLIEITPGTPKFVYCGSRQPNRIIRTYAFEDKGQMEEYVVRIQALM